MDYSEELKWAKEKEQELKQKYAGKWVVIHNMQVVAAGEDPMATLEEAKRKTGLDESQLTVKFIRP